MKHILSLFHAFELTHIYRMRKTANANSLKISLSAELEKYDFEIEMKGIYDVRHRLLQ